MNFAESREGLEDAAIESHATWAMTETSTEYCIATQNRLRPKNWNFLNIHVPLSHFSRTTRISVRRFWQIKRLK